MKKKKGIGLSVVLIVLVLLLAAAAWLVFSHFYVWAAGAFRQRDSRWLDLQSQDITQESYNALQEQFPDAIIAWNVPLAGGKYSSVSRRLELPSLREDELATLSLFPMLTDIHIASLTEPELVQKLQQLDSVQVTYSVPVGGNVYAWDVQSIVAADISAELLTERLSLLPALSDVELRDALIDPDLVQELEARFPTIHFFWKLERAGSVWDSDQTSLDLTGKQVTLDQAMDLFRLLPQLTSADMSDTTLSESEMLKLMQAYPACSILWYPEIAGKKLASDSEEIDLSGVHFSSVSEVESRLAYFPSLKRVVMCGCGFDDETMAALNDRYPDIRFVWSVNIAGYSVRTDATYFYPYLLRKDLYVNNQDVYPLRYCTDMVAIDVGHMRQITDCEWVRFMPNLQYLILIETGITDLSPLSCLKNLVFLEIFSMDLRDYSPLLGCTALEDLNLGWTYGPEEPILQMTWLRNLWWGGIEGSTTLPCSDAPAKLREALSNTYMKFNMDNPNVGNGWRKLDNYKKMRDILGMYYLD